MSENDELPFIGRPARDALAEIGITRASQLAAYTEKQLLALHGVGPKAIRLLREAGVTLREAGECLRNRPRSAGRLASSRLT